MKQIRFTIKSNDFEQVEQYDRMMREHNWIAMQAGNELNRKKLEIAIANDPELEARWKKGFVDIGIDWKTKELVVSPTMDPQKKALEAADALAAFQKKK